MLSLGPSFLDLIGLYMKRVYWKTIPSIIIPSLPNRPFAASHSRGTKLLCWRTKVALGQDKQTHNLKWLFSLFVLSQCDFCSPAQWFCATWMASCKGPIPIHPWSSNLQQLFHFCTTCTFENQAFLECYRSQSNHTFWLSSKTIHEGLSTDLCHPVLPQ